jgi:H+/gluconate symporter-like permease
MDTATSTIIIAIITGVFGVITAIINKNQKKLMVKVEQQNLLLKKEKSLRQQLNEKERERESIIHEMMLLILETNMNILQNQHADVLDANFFNRSEDLKRQFQEVTNCIDDIYKQYEMILDMNETLQHTLQNDNS